MEPDFIRTSIFKSAVFAYTVTPTQETFRHKVTVSVEIRNITFKFSSKNQKLQNITVPNRFSRSTETRKELQLPAIQKLCLDACQRLMIHPYITASRTIVNILLS